MSLSFENKARREMMACFFLVRQNQAAPSIFPALDAICSVRNIMYMYFITSRVTRKSVQTSDYLFCVPFDTGFHRYDVYNFLPDQ
jgi:hypothetical protein